jgi:flagellar hook assembly protein FlgD
MSTKIAYGLSIKEQVKLAIYDQSGRCMKVLVNETQTKGSFSVIWNGSNSQGESLPKGIYHSVLSINSGETRVKLIKVE